MLHRIGHPRAYGPSAAGQRRLGLLVRRLDWLARFRVEHGTPGEPPRVVERDGTIVEGGAAVRLALSRLPVTAWFALPTLLLPGARRRAAASGAPA